MVENLVAGLEIETHAKAVGEPSRGRGKAVTLRIRYRFEVPELEDVPPLPFAGRLGHTAASVLELSIMREHVGLNFVFDQFAGARDAARKILLANPTILAKDVNALVMAQRGQTLSRRAYRESKAD